MLFAPYTTVIFEKKDWHNTIYYGSYLKEGTKAELGHVLAKEILVTRYLGNRAKLS